MAINSKQITIKPNDYIFAQPTLNRIREWGIDRFPLAVDYDGVIASIDNPNFINPFAAETLARFKELGYSPFLWTSNSREHVEPTLTGENLMQFFGMCIYAGNYRFIDPEKIIQDEVLTFDFPQFDRSGEIIGHEITRQRKVSYASDPILARARSKQERAFLQACKTASWLTEKDTQAIRPGNNRGPYQKQMQVLFANAAIIDDGVLEQTMQFDIPDSSARYPFVRPTAFSAKDVSECQPNEIDPRCFGPWVVGAIQKLFPVS